MGARPWRPPLDPPLFLGGSAPPPTGNLGSTSVISWLPEPKCLSGEIAYISALLLSAQLSCRKAMLSVVFVCISVHSGVLCEHYRSYSATDGGPRMVT